MDGYLDDTWRIWLENAIFLPFLLVFLFNRNERVSLFGLRLLEMKHTSNIICTYALQLFRLGEVDFLQSLRDSIRSSHICV